MLLQLEGKPGQAEPYLREALQQRRHVLGEENPDTLSSINSLGNLLLAEGKSKEAEPYLREALEKKRHVLGDEHPDTLISAISMGSLLVAQGKHAEAVKLLGTSETATRKAFTGNNAFRLASLLMSLGKAHTALGEFATAETDLLEAQVIFVKTQSPSRDNDLRECTRAVRDLYAAWNSAEPGKGHDAKSVEWKRKLDALGAPSSPAPPTR